jgi:hypothetical protein
VTRQLKNFVLKSVDGVVGLIELLLIYLLQNDMHQKEMHVLTFKTENCQTFRFLVWLKSSLLTFLDQDLGNPVEICYFLEAMD